MPDNPEIFTQSDFVNTIDVSRETLERLEIYIDLLHKWQKRINLVGPKTLDDAWRRHILDSAQVYNLVKDVNGPILDLGSGAGFPGLVLAVMGIRNITLIEANQKKCSFLGEVIRQTNSSAQVFSGRIEDYQAEEKADVITARALASLEDLLSWAAPLLKKDGKCVFLKGSTYQDELTLSEKKWTLQVQITPSIVTNNDEKADSSTGVILEIDKLSQRLG